MQHQGNFLPSLTFIILLRPILLIMLTLIRLVKLNWFSYFNSSNYYDHYDFIVDIKNPKFTISPCLIYTAFL